MTIYMGNNLIAGGSTYHPPLFATQWSDHEIQDISWLRADTFSWHSGTTYSTAYAELVSEYNNASSVEETESDLSRPNFTKVGSPIIYNGVVSNFTQSNYLTITSPSTTLSSLEIMFKFTTGSSVTGSTYQAPLGQLNTNKTTPQLDLLATSGQPEFLLPSDSSTWVNITSTSIIMSPNATYWCKMLWDGSTYTAYISTNGSTWTTVGSASMSTCIWTDPMTLGVDQPLGATDSHFLGSIDLKESYIKINNSLWWTGFDQITYKRTPKGYKIADTTQETAILNKYNSDGIAWYYILDTANTQFKLPRTKFGFEGYRDKVGDYIPESLPNITGTVGSLQEARTIQATGAFSQVTTGTAGWSGNTDGTYDVTFNASRSSSTYQNNAPVQERSTQMYLYFYVGQFSQSAIEQTAGLNAELFNNKADINASNFNTTGKSLLSSLGMPSSRYIDLTLGASGSTYTAPANGWFVCQGKSEIVGKFIRLRGIAGTTAIVPEAWEWAYCIQPVTKNREIIVTYNTDQQYTTLKFYYAEGEPSS